MVLGEGRGVNQDLRCWLVRNTNIWVGGVPLSQAEALRKDEEVLGQGEKEDREESERGDTDA